MKHFPRKRVWLTEGRAMMVVAAGVAVCIHACLAVTHLHRGMEAPAFALKDRNGLEVSSEKLRHHVVVLIFGELYHDKTRQAWNIVGTVLKDDRFASHSIVPVLVAAEEMRAEDLKVFLGGRVSPTIVHDPDRRAFGAFRVAAMPSVVVIGADGGVIYAVGALVPRFPDNLTDALLFACGKLSAEGLDRAMNPVATTRATESEIRADRVVHLASQLARRGLPEMAAEKYREALTLNSRHSQAHLGLASVLLRQRQLTEAEGQFRIVLAEHPESLEGSLGMAYVHVLRGGQELKEAERIVRDVLSRSPVSARAHYLLGLVYEQQNQATEAAASFKRASELLFQEYTDDR